MSKNPHKHNAEQHPHNPGKPGLHKDWRAWTVVILMLVAMGVYVLSLDESVGPGATENATQEPIAP
jgi:hypothetical protein